MDRPPVSEIIMLLHVKGSNKAVRKLVETATWFYTEKLMGKRLMGSLEITIDLKRNFLAKTVNTLTIGIKPNLIINEKKLLINLQLIFPNKDFNKIKKKIKKKKYFLL